MKTRRSLLWVFIMPAFLFSQPDKDRSNKEKKERIEAMKIAYITEKLDLSPEEAKEFWPVYNKYEKDHYDLRKSKKNLEKEAKEKWKSEGNSLDKIKEKDLDDYMESVFEIKDKENQLNRKYHIEFKKVLSPHKVLLLYKSKRDFKKEILRMIKKRNSEYRPPRRIDN
jgi:hypothetical protein